MVAMEFRITLNSQSGLSLFSMGITDKLNPSLLDPFTSVLILDLKQHSLKVNMIAKIHLSTCSFIHSTNYGPGFVLDAENLSGLEKSESA